LRSSAAVFPKTGCTVRSTDELVAGGGVAGLEVLLALRALAGDRIDLTLVAPNPE
jgi:hypothetical protein